MNATSTFLFVAALSFGVAVSKAQDPPPDLVEAVTPTTIPAVTFTVKVDGLTRPNEPSGDIGDRVHQGQSFTLRDGEKLRLYDHARRTRYELEARLSDKPPILWIRTTIRTGKDDLFGQVIGGAKVRVSRIPIR